MIRRWVIWLLFMLSLLLNMSGKHSTKRCILVYIIIYSSHFKHYFCLLRKCIIHSQLYFVKLFVYYFRMDMCIVNILTMNIHYFRNAKLYFSHGLALLRRYYYHCGKGIGSLLETYNLWLQTFTWARVNLSHETDLVYIYEVILVHRFSLNVSRETDFL